jgi:site-specific DNA recombinase
VTTRCAIYTRKSSEGGLEQDFNSIDAQYAACLAYVASQAGEGWVLLEQRYDDGGASGGTLERTGLIKLLEDVRAGLIDIVVVYKVDRLTRSLLDFAKLVEAFDSAGTSFVSVTQAFNTTTSIGRLTLNMLLSFAQFEREVTAERIRDKIAASKQRGMWMGGTPPIGYKPDGRSLAIVEDHAAIIRMIFDTYLELGTIRALYDLLTRRRIHQPLRMTMQGRPFGGRPFSRGQLYHLLKNPLYAGRIRHGGKTYPGLHAAIIDEETWERVQRQLNDNTQGERLGPLTKNASPLAGKLVDQRGEPLVAVHASKKKVRYRYYVSRHLQHGKSAKRPGGAVPAAHGIRVPAREIEQLLAQAVVEKLRDPIALGRGLEFPLDQEKFLGALVGRADALISILEGQRGRMAQSLLGSLVRRADILDKSVRFTIASDRLASELGYENPDQECADLAMTLPVRIRRTGLAVRLVHQTGQSATPAPVDDKLLAAIARGRNWWTWLQANPGMTVTDLAKLENLPPTYVDRILRMGFLAPKVVEAVVKSTAPAHLSLNYLKDLKLVTPLWSDQQKFLESAPVR